MHPGDWSMSISMNFGHPGDWWVSISMNFGHPGDWWMSISMNFSLETEREPQMDTDSHG